MRFAVEVSRPATESANTSEPIASTTRPQTIDAFRPKARSTLSSNEIPAVPVLALPNAASATTALLTATRAPMRGALGIGRYASRLSAGACGSSLSTMRLAATAVATAVAAGGAATGLVRRLVNRAGISPVGATADCYATAHERIRNG